MTVASVRIGIAAALLLAATFVHAQVAAPPQAVTIEFDEKGAVAPASAAARAALPELLAGHTDVFVLSHGWRNDPQSAECRYRLQMDGIAAALPPAAVPLFVKIVWPSATFPMAVDACEGERKAPFFADQRPRATVRDVDAWAHAAFPTAARRRTFSVDVQRLSAALALADTTPDLGPVRDAAAILVAWRDAGEAGGARELRSEDAPGERPAPVTADDLVRAYEALRTPQPERGPVTGVLGIAEVFSFWTMKARAGIVGSRGVHDLLADIAAARGARNVRVHLVGHSFGGKLVSAAVVGRAGGSPPVAVDSLTILQGAFSYLSFADADAVRALGIPVPGEGVYADVVRKPLVRAMAVTYSSEDRENQRWYPMGAGIGQDMFERASLYAALGARGIAGVPSVPVVLREGSVAGRFEPSRPRIFNVDASGVVLGHSDIMQPRVFKLIADVVNVAARPRAAAAK